MGCTQDLPRPLRPGQAFDAKRAQDPTNSTFHPRKDMRTLATPILTQPPALSSVEIERCMLAVNQGPLRLPTVRILRLYDQNQLFECSNVCLLPLSPDAAFPGKDAAGINLKFSFRIEPENFSQDGTKKPFGCWTCGCTFLEMQSRSNQRA